MYIIMYVLYKTSIKYIYIYLRIIIHRYSNNSRSSSSSSSSILDFSQTLRRSAAVCPLVRSFSLIGHWSSLSSSPQSAI